MHLRLYRRIVSVALILGVLVASLAVPVTASAYGCTVCLSPSGDTYYGSSSSSFNSYSSYPSYSSYSSSSSYGGYGAISETTGLPRTNYVSSYTRSDGTYVSPYYRSCSYCTYP
jgi:hypothetical protein